MPPSYSVSNASVMSLSMIAKHENQEIMTVLHYRLSAGAIVDDGKALLSAFSLKVVELGGVLEKWQACLSVKAVAVIIRSQWITPQRFAYDERAVFPGEGAVAGNAYPVNTAVAITRRTDFAGRGEVATIHMPGVPLTFLLNGAVTDLGVAAYADFGVASLEKITTVTPAAEFYPIAFRRTNPTESRQLTGYSIKPTARIQRRRTVGLGT